MSIFDSKKVCDAEMSIMREFRKWAETHIDEDKLESFFDPRNRDEYERSFANYLSRAREFASND